MSEFRQDPCSGDWVIIAPGRANRPDALGGKREPRRPAPKKGCPFENLHKTGNWPPLAVYPEAKNWRIAVIPNKYPAIVHGDQCAVLINRGLYTAETGVGRHELIVTRDHNKNFAALRPSEAAKVMAVFQARHREAAKDPCVVYATTFFNWGPSVGGSVWHPHYQLMALPFTPPHAESAFTGAKNYFKKNHRCVRCDIIKEERKIGKRVIAENEFAIAFAPYASKRPYEVQVIPKRHLPSFRETPPSVLTGVAAILQSVLLRIKRYAGDPDLNFFIHDPPLKGDKHPYHHWHIEVMPSVSRLGGLEFSTAIYINVTDPEAAAAVLRHD